MALKGSGKLKGLFKKKEGGSALGNALRFVGDKFTGGTYSSLFPKPTDKDIEKDPTVVYAGNSEASSEQQTRDQQRKEKELDAKAKNKQIITIVGIGVGAIALIGIIWKLLTKKKK